MTLQDEKLEADGRYLDAARDSIVQVGWRRTTLTDIARRAGVSRMTIYRRWSDTRALLGDLLVREWTALAMDSGLATKGLAEGITCMAAALRENELLLRIIEVDPELLTPYLFERIGRNQSMALDLIERRISEGQARGEFRSGSPQLLAQSLLLAAYGFVLSAHTLEVSLEELDTELTTLVERFLAA